MRRPGARAHVSDVTPGTDLIERGRYVFNTLGAPMHMQLQFLERLGAYINKPISKYLNRSLSVSIVET